MALARDHELKVLEPFGLARAEELKTTLRQMIELHARVARRLSATGRREQRAPIRLPDEVQHHRRELCRQLIRQRHHAVVDRHQAGMRRCAPAVPRHAARRTDPAPPSRSASAARMAPMRSSMRYDGNRAMPLLDVAARPQGIEDERLQQVGARRRIEGLRASATARRDGCRRCWARPRRSADAAPARDGRLRRCTASTTAPAPAPRPHGPRPARRRSRRRCGGRPRRRARPAASSSSSAATPAHFSMLAGAATGAESPKPAVSMAIA